MDVILWLLCCLQTKKTLWLIFGCKPGPKQFLLQYMVPLLIMIIMGFILKEMPVIISSQVGVIDGVITPWEENLRGTPCQYL